MSTDRKSTPIPRPYGSAPPPATRLSRVRPGRSANSKRIIEVQILARVIYQHHGESYLRTRCEDEHVHLINMETRTPLGQPKHAALTVKAFERMIAEKVIVRRLYIGEDDAFSIALLDHFRTGTPLGEFVNVQAVRIVPSRHLSCSRRFAGKRVKRLS
jgi:hypothetical protein